MLIGSIVLSVTGSAAELVQPGKERGTAAVGREASSCHKSRHSGVNVI